MSLDDLPRDPDQLLRHLQQMAEVIARQNAALSSLQTERDAVLAERDAARTECDAAQAEIEKLRLLIRQLQRGGSAGARRSSTPTSCSSAWRTSSRPWPPPR